MNLTHCLLVKKGTVYYQKYLLTCLVSNITLNGISFLTHLVSDDNGSLAGICFLYCVPEGFVYRKS